MARSTDIRKGPCFGQRHVLVVCLNLGLIIIYCLRANLSVALVAMVNNTDTQPSHNRSSIHNDCPQPSANASGAPSRVTSVGPQFPWSRPLQGLVLSSFFWGYILLQVPAGTIAQRYGAKWMFGVGVVWTSSLTLLTPVVAEHSVYLLIALRVLEGVGESVTFPAMMAMLGRWAPPQETSRLMSLAVVGATLGIILGQITTGPICSSELLGGWPSVFYINGAIGLLWFLPWYLLVSDSPNDHPRISKEERDYIREAIGTDQEQANIGPIPWRRILLFLPVWVYIFSKGVGAWIDYTLLTCLPQFLSDVLHFDISANGIMASLPHISFFLTANVFTWMCDTLIARGCLNKTNARKLFSLVSLWGCGSSLVAITFIKCNPTLVLVLLIGGYALSSAVFAGYASNHLDLSPEYAGTIFGMSNVLSTAAGIVAPLVTDAITVDGTAAQWNFVFYIASGVAGGGGLVYLLLASTRRQDWAGQLSLTSAGWETPDDEDGEETTDEIRPILSVNIPQYGNNSDFARSPNVNDEKTRNKDC